MSKKPSPAPRFVSESGRYLDYVAVLRFVRRTPNRWVLVYPAAPTTRAKALRLRLPRCDVRIRNRYQDGGVPRGDIEVRFPKED